MNSSDTTSGAVAWRTMGAVLGFGIYAFVCAQTPPDPIPAQDTVQAHLPEPLTAWRSQGCQTCHSLFGLGGHTGPDLTNVISRTSPEFVRAMIRIGPPGMPDYAHLGETTVDAIVTYLGQVDRTASYPPRSLGDSVFGGNE